MRRIGGATAMDPSGKNGKRWFALLDRDGTLMVDRNYQKDPELTELLPGVAEGLRVLADAGFGLVLVTNQSGIAHGYLTIDQFHAVNRRLFGMLTAIGVAFDGAKFCPHAPGDACVCRKPADGMAKAAATELGFAPGEAFVVGDRDCDIGLGGRFGARTVLVRTGGGRETEAAGQCRPDYVADDMVDAARWMIAIRDGVPTAEEQS